VFSAPATQRLNPQMSLAIHDMVEEQSLETCLSSEETCLGPVMSGHSPVPFQQ